MEGELFKNKNALISS